MGRATRDRLLDGATALLLLAGLALLVQERALPALRERARVDPGERMPRAGGLLDPTTGDTLRLDGLRPALYLVYRSDCPACAANLPAWRRLLIEAPPEVRILAVGLEPASTSTAYARAHLGRARAVLPLDPARFTRRLRLQLVPSTLYVDGGGRLRFRHQGLLPAERSGELRELFPESGPPPRRPDTPGPGSGPISHHSGRRRSS